MRATIFLLLASFCIASAAGCERNRHTTVPQSADGSLTFGDAALGSGTVITRREAATAHGKAIVRGRRVPVEIETVEARREKLLTSERARPDVLVTYNEAFGRSYSRVTGESKKTKPVALRTYRVRRRNGSLDIDRVGGGKANFAEKLEVLSDYGSGRWQSPVIDDLHGQTIRYGETILAQSVPTLPDATVRMQLVEELRRGDQRIAVFDVQIAGRVDGGRYELEGEALVNVENAALVSLTASGPWTQRFQGAKLRGQMDMGLSYDFK